MIKGKIRCKTGYEGLLGK